MSTDWVSSSVADYDAFIFDCDGVVWRGDHPIPGVVQTVQRLRQLGKTTLFITNGSGKSRATLSERFTRMGLDTPPSHILSSSYSAAACVARLPDFDHKHHKALVIGGPGIAEELALNGIASLHVDDVLAGSEGVGGWGVGSEAAASGGHLSRSQLHQLPVDVSVRAVVVGLDKTLTYTKAAYAAKYLKDASIPFVATNLADLDYPVAAQRSGTQLLPAGGTCARFVAAAGGRSLDHVVRSFGKGLPPSAIIDCGKPNPWMLQEAKERLGLEAKRTLMVGDRLNSDILFGQQGAVDTLLVFTGCTTPAAAAQSDIRPTYVASSAAAILTASNL